MIELLRKKLNTLGYYYMNDGKSVESYIIESKCFTFYEDMHIYIGRDIKLGDIYLSDLFKEDIIKIGRSFITGETLFILPDSITKKE